MNRCETKRRRAERNLLSVGTAARAGRAEKREIFDIINAHDFVLPIAEVALRALCGRWRRRGNVTNLPWFGHEEAIDAIEQGLPTRAPQPHDQQPVMTSGDVLASVGLTFNA